MPADPPHACALQPSSGCGRARPRRSSGRASALGRHPTPPPCTPAPTATGSVRMSDIPQCKLRRAAAPRSWVTASARPGPTRCHGPPRAPRVRPRPARPRQVRTRYQRIIGIEPRRPTALRPGRRARSRRATGGRWTSQAPRARRRRARGSCGRAARRRHRRRARPARSGPRWPSLMRSSAPVGAGMPTGVSGVRRAIRPLAARSTAGAWSRAPGPVRSTPSRSWTSTALRGSGPPGGTRRSHGEREHRWSPLDTSVRPAPRLHGVGRRERRGPAWSTAGSSSRQGAGRLTCYYDITDAPRRSQQVVKWMPASVTVKGDVALVSSRQIRVVRDGVRWAVATVALLAVAPGRDALAEPPVLPPSTPASSTAGGDVRDERRGRSAELAGGPSRQLRRRWPNSVRCRPARAQTRPCARGVAGPDGRDRAPRAPPEAPAPPVGPAATGVAGATGQTGPACHRLPAPTGSDGPCTAPPASCGAVGAPLRHAGSSRGEPPGFTGVRRTQRHRRVTCGTRPRRAGSRLVLVCGDTALRA